MNWCQPHWTQLREAIEARGMEQFIAKTGQEAAKNLVAEIKGEEAPFDPLMGCWSLINSRMLESAGLRAVMSCPCCILVEDGQPNLVEQWINGASDDAYNHAVHIGVIKVQ